MTNIFQETIEYLNLYHNGFSIALSMMFSVISGFFAWRSKKSEATLAKDLEQYKYELQSEYIKMELRTKQLFVKYPEMFSLFQKLNGELYELRGPVKRSREIRQNAIDKCANSELLQANNFFAFNMLFFSPEVRKLAILVKDSMVTCLFSETEEEGVKNFEKAQTFLGELEKQMKKELGHLV